MFSYVSATKTEHQIFMQLSFFFNGICDGALPMIYTNKLSSSKYMRFLHFLSITVCVCFNCSCWRSRLWFQQSAYFTDYTCFYSSSLKNRSRLCIRASICFPWNWNRFRLRNRCKHIIVSCHWLQSILFKVFYRRAPLVHCYLCNTL